MAANQFPPERQKEKVVFPWFNRSENHKVGNSLKRDFNRRLGDGSVVAEWRDQHGWNWEALGMGMPAERRFGASRVHNDSLAVSERVFQPLDVPFFFPRV
jgi:hypothetical protein